MRALVKSVCLIYDIFIYLKTYWLFLSTAHFFCASNFIIIICIETTLRVHFIFDFILVVCGPLKYGEDCSNTCDCGDRASVCDAVVGCTSMSFQFTHCEMSIMYNISFMQYPSHTCTLFKVNECIFSMYVSLYNIGYLYVLEMIRGKRATSIGLVSVFHFFNFRLHIWLGR